MGNSAPAPTDTTRKLTVVVLGLAALITAMLCAFALPSLHSGPHRISIGVTGTPSAAQDLKRGLDGDTWRAVVYGSASELTSAIERQDVVGGLALDSGGLDVYTATVGAPSATNALTALGNNLAAQRDAHATVHELVPFTPDDPRGAGLNAALMPIIFSGIFPALILSSFFPGRRGLRTRLAGASMPGGRLRRRSGPAVRDPLHQRRLLAERFRRHPWSDRHVLHHPRSAGPLGHGWLRLRRSVNDAPGQPWASSFPREPQAASCEPTRSSTARRPGSPHWSSPDGSSSESPAHLADRRGRRTPLAHSKPTLVTQHSPAPTPHLESVTQDR